jgi:hypothetical protein
MYRVCCLAAIACAEFLDTCPGKQAKHVTWTHKKLSEVGCAFMVKNQQVGGSDTVAGIVGLHTSAPHASSSPPLLLRALTVKVLIFLLRGKPFACMLHKADHGWSHAYSRVNSIVGWPWAVVWFAITTHTYTPLFCNNVRTK